MKIEPKQTTVYRVEWWPSAKDSQRSVERPTLNLARQYVRETRLTEYRIVKETRRLEVLEVMPRRLSEKHP